MKREQHLNVLSMSQDWKMSQTKASIHRLKQFHEGNVQHLQTCLREAETIWRWIQYLEMDLHAIPEQRQHTPKKAGTPKPAINPASQQRHYILEPRANVREVEQNQNIPEEVSIIHEIITSHRDSLWLQGTAYLPINIAPYLVEYLE